MHHNLIPPLIPKPRLLELKQGYLQLGATIALWADQNTHDLLSVQQTLNKILNGFNLPMVVLVEHNPVSDPYPGSQQEDGYSLEVGTEGIWISGKACYALQSLAQLFWWAHHHKAGQVPCLMINDYPEFTWRGLHLDVSRHFFTADEVCSYLDSMARIKLNRFHWHLTDDQGWRIESQMFPRLNSIGSWRKESDGSVYGGFYTQEEIKRVLSHASVLGIEVIPEIDIPGHSLAILASYNELACFPQTFETLNCWGISEEILCAGKNETLDFLKQLFTEIAGLFPSSYFHLGGDEAPKTNWQKCPHCQKRIKEKGLANEEELQSWLMKELIQHLKSLGKTVIAWDEILDGKPGTEPIVMVWRGDGKEAAGKAEASGNHYILCPNQICYFDWHQFDKADEPGAFGTTTLEQVYSFEPRAYENGNAKLLLGAQANVWTEQMLSFERVRYMAFPRAIALAERLWSCPDEEELGDFLQRLKVMKGCL